MYTYMYACVCTCVCACIYVCDSIRVLYVCDTRYKHYVKAGLHMIRKVENN